MIVWASSKTKSETLSAIWRIKDAQGPIRPSGERNTKLTWPLLMSIFTKTQDKRKDICSVQLSIKLVNSKQFY